MKESSKYKVQGSNLKSAAFLWDESFLWGVMAYKALREAGLIFDLVLAEDVRNGCLDRYAALFVPGGWASNKVKSLGRDGVEAIKRFVHDGGSYLGFCGGAGLATMDGIGLVPVKRRPTQERVPSFSGRIKLITDPHPVWQGISEPVFHAWWPSQFVIDRSVNVLAAYGNALPDSFSSDVNVGDAEAVGSWPELERVYQINLDPKRLFGEPAVIEGTFGKGKVLLSLVHFDTPGDAGGSVVLKNLWRYLLPNVEQGLRIADCTLHSRRALASAGINGMGIENAQNSRIISELEETVDNLISLGQRNFLWFWRNPLLLQWRRGVRGLEYNTLSIMVKELAELLRGRGTEDGGQGTGRKLERIRALLLSFADKAKRLLVLERYAMQNGHITYERCDDPDIQAMREKLFSRSKSHGGLFKEVLDEIDGFLYDMLIDTRRLSLRENAR